MHFWINKGSQGRGINGRYVPPSISAGARRNQLCGEIHPKPMVTPVHRFQSIESVATGAHRHPRAPTYHTRFPIPHTTHHHQNNHHGEFGGPPQTTRQSNTSRAQRQSLEFAANGQQVTLTPVASTTSSPIAKLKCGVWAIIGLIPFFVAAAKYYFMGANMGMEVLAVCAILILILLVGGFVSLFEAFGSKVVHAQSSAQISSEQNETFEDSSIPGPTNTTPVHVELPPPPYNIAVMLPPTQDERLNIIQDSPPPTYEKAVT